MRALAARDGRYQCNALEHAAETSGGQESAMLLLWSSATESSFIDFLLKKKIQRGPDTRYCS